MDYLNSQHVAVTVYNVCQQIQTDPTQVPEWQPVATLIGTAAVQSGFALGNDRPRNIGLGLFGLNLEKCLELYDLLDYRTAFQNGWDDELKGRFMKWVMFSKAWTAIKSIPYVQMERRDFRYLLAHDVRFAAAMCRWVYLSFNTKEPETLDEIAAIWAHFYAPGGDAQEFIDAWQGYQCTMLMVDVGYE